MSHGGHGGHGANSDESRLGLGADSYESRREHAGYQCLGCRQIWSTLFALGQHAGSPYLRGTRCGVQNSVTELWNVPCAHLGTGQARAVPIYRPGAQGRSVMGNNVNIWLLLPISYCLFLLIIDLRENGSPAPGW